MQDSCQLEAWLLYGKNLQYKYEVSRVFLSSIYNLTGQKFVLKIFTGYSQSSISYKYLHIIEYSLMHLETSYKYQNHLKEIDFVLFCKVNIFNYLLKSS